MVGLSASEKGKLFEVLVEVQCGLLIEYLQIKHYIDFRIGAEWRAISNELSAESVVPIPADRRALEKAIEKRDHTAAIVKEYQAGLSEQEKKVHTRFSFALTHLGSETWLRKYCSISP